MASSTNITVYWGPLAWFESEIGSADKHSLMDEVFLRDEERREIHVTVPGQEDAVTTQRKRPKRLVAKSNDYASLREHVITNFTGLIRELKPKELVLHNPPEQICRQLKHAFSESYTEVRYSYPAITFETLKTFQNEFADHLVGQHHVRDKMITAMHQLSRASRNKPVVVMLYGPSGVGKTETAYFINKLLSGKLMRKQFSMFQNEKFASYMFGGTHSEASFAHDLLNRESGVILIDEFDKAASVFHSAFYQFFDEGIFEDKNYNVSVGRSLIICTSNYESVEEIEKAVGDALISRFDALIPFHYLDDSEMMTVATRLANKKYSELELDEQSMIDLPYLQEVSQRVAGGEKNIRRLGKSIDELISLMIINVLNNAESS